MPVYISTWGLASGQRFYLDERLGGVFFPVHSDTAAGPTVNTGTSRSGLCSTGQRGFYMKTSAARWTPGLETGPGHKLLWPALGRTHGSKKKKQDYGAIWVLEVIQPTGSL